MDMLIGIVVGVVLAVVAFIALNRKHPDKVDQAEDKIRKG